MEASVLDVERADNQSSDTSSMSSIVVYEAPKAQLGGPVVENADSLPEDSVTNSQQELTEHVTGDAATHDNNNKSPAFQTPPTSQTFFPPQANGSPTAHTPRFDPRALLNPKSAAAKRPASSGQDSERGRTEPTVTGQVSLVERLHNVQERTASPAKRVKTEDPPKQNGNRANFGGGSALDLQNPNGQPPPPQPQQRPAIDLTMSDDDEIEVVGDNGNEDVCIGKLKQTYIQAHYVPFPDPKKAGTHGGTGRIKVAFRRSGKQQGNHIIFVLDGMGKEFGKVDMKTAQGLAPLMDAAKINGLKWVAWTDPRRKLPHEGNCGTELSALIGMTLQLYCPRRMADNLGRMLKGKNLLLITPQFELARHDYYNPQTKVGFQKAQALQPNFQPAMADQYAVGAPNSNYILRSVDEIRADVADVFDTVVTNSETVPTREPSPLIKTELYPHQKQALYFMVDHEQEHTVEDYDQRKDSLWKPRFRNNGRKSYVHVITGEETEVQPRPGLGGILADEMGLGKTLSILSLICDDASIAASTAFSEKKPPPKQNPTMLQPVYNSRATLLVCPLSTMTNWKEQIKEHFPEGVSTLKWCRYHGSERFKMKAAELADHDIVLTTYHIIAKDLLDRKRPLPYINWFRIVLDEAHTIRNPTNQSKATCMMMGQRRWAVTGTPVQNRLEDLGALFNFIQLAPFNTAQGFNQYILHPFKNADPEVVPKLQLLVSTVTIRRTKEIIKAEVPAKLDYVVKLQFSRDERQLHDWFEKDTQRKVLAVTQGEKMGGRSYASILTAILNLRLICAHGRDLLSENALKTTDGMTYDQPMEIEEEGQEIPQLTRQQAYEMLSLLGSTEADECLYCTGKKPLLDVDSEDSDDEEEGNVNDTIGYMTTCYHLVCPKHFKKLKDAWRQNLQEDGLVRCHVCDDINRPSALELKRNDYNNYLEERERMRKDPKLAKKVNTYTGPHTKTKALLNDLDEFRQWSVANPEQRPIKSIVFSSWTTHLDLILIALNHSAHPYVRLDGRMTREARDRSMSTFKLDPSITVMLVSIGAGGLGLNLTTANKVFMMEPQFNPAAEAQAVDRVHRLGQDREVVIKRFVMQDSFEEKMLVLQEKKKALADLTLERKKGAAGREKLEELRSLFR